MNKREVILFAAPDWCNSSRLMRSIFKSVSENQSLQKLKFTFLDVEETQFAVNMSCKYEVRNVPTILVVENGKVLERIKGAQRGDRLVKMLSKWK